MKCYNSWRQAVLMSICIHCIVFVGIGLFSISSLTDELPTNYIEMELVSDPTVPFTTPTQAVEQIQTSPTQVSTTPQMETPGQEQSNIVRNFVGGAGNHEIQAIAGYSSFPGKNVSNTGTEQSFSGNIGTESSTEIKPEILPPRILRKIEPTYPEQARLQGWQGKVNIRVEVLSDGLPGDITVKKSSGYPLLDDAAVKAIKRWRFVPAKNIATDMPQACYTSVSLIFTLN